MYVNSGIRWVRNGYEFYTFSDTPYENRHKDTKTGLVLIRNKRKKRLKSLGEISITDIIT